MTGKSKIKQQHLTCVSHEDCEREALNSAEQLCDEKNLQLTDIRKTVLKLIWRSHQPAKAYDLLDELGKQGYCAKPPTIYRALDFLLEHGLIHKLNKINAYIGCSHPEQNHLCSLMICSSCGDITECCHQGLNHALQNVADSFHFRLNQKDLELEGVCENCL